MADQWWTLRMVPRFLLTALLFVAEARQALALPVEPRGCSR